MKERTTNQWLSVGAYARTYGLSRQTVYKLLQAELLETYTVLSVRRIHNKPPNEHKLKPQRTSV